MKTLNIVLEDTEYALLVAAKGKNTTWKEYLMKRLK